MKTKNVYHVNSLLFDRAFFVLFFFSVFCFYGKAQAGDNDPTFNSTDVGFGSGDGLNLNGYVNKTVLQSDGKIIICGRFTSYNQTSRNRIARLNTDGTLDDSFNPGAGPSATSTPYSITTIAIQSDGKIIIGGNFVSYNGTPVNRIARLNADGTLDATFNSITGTDNLVNSISFQSDGKIIIGGQFNTYNGTTRRAIVRLNPDGALDRTFNSDMDVNSTVRSCSIQSDGKIIISGVFVYGAIAKYFARLNADGTLDNTFDAGTGANDLGVGTTAIQSDGKIIIGGTFTSYNETPISSIARVNINGTLDTSFNTGKGATAVNTVYATVLQSDGKIIIGGTFTSYNGTPISRIARLNTDGTFDTSFNPGMGANQAVSTTVIQSDGKIIIGGGFTSYDGTILNYISRLHADGTLDTSFNSGNGVNYVDVGGKAATINSASIQVNGKIIIGGSFSSYNGITRNNIARLNANGDLDNSFNPGAGANCSTVGNIPILTTATQPDGKIIIGGNFNSYNGTLINRIARLNADGTIDTAFNPGTGANLAVNTTAIQSDGKVIIGGNFTSYNGIVVNHISRLNTDGTLDDAFNSNSGVNSSVSTITIQNDGKIIIGGNFSLYNNETVRHQIARINADGTVDATFKSIVGPNGLVYTTLLQNDGKIIIGGAFTTYNGIARNGIARLNTDGTLDTAFNTGEGATGQVYTSSIQNDGKIIVGGKFTFFNGYVRNNIARLNVDGSVDDTFNPGTGVTGVSTYGIPISTTAIQSDGKIIIGGDFTCYNGTGRNRIARILNSFTDGISTLCQKVVSIYPNPISTELHIEIVGNNEPVKFDILNLNGQVVFEGNLVEKTTVQTTNFAPGVYLIKLGNDKTFEFKKIVIE